MSRTTISNAPADQSLAGELVAVARVARTRGLRGEVMADLLTDFPERFENLTSVIAVVSDGRRFALTLEDHWFQAGRVVLKFAGYDTIEQAEALTGCEIAVAEEESVELEAYEFYHWQLQGCAVETIAGEYVGRVGAVLETGGVPVLVVEDADNRREHLIPLAEAICVEIDMAAKRLRIDPPEGLLDVCSSTS